MDVQSISAILFVALLSLFLYMKRKKLQMQKILFPLLYFLMYKSRFGLQLMSSMAKRYGKALRMLANVAIVIGFIGMLFIGIFLTYQTIKVLAVEGTPPGVKPIQPFSANVPGTVFVPFFYFILSILIIATVHEFSHGVVARAYGIPLKSSGFAFIGIFLPIIPAAFVEPDEKQLRKRPPKEQLAVFSAGPFSNIVLGFMMLGLFLLTIGPVTDNLFESDGIMVQELIEGGHAAEDVGIKPGEVIIELDDEDVTDFESFIDALARHRPGDMVEVVTNETSYLVTLGQSPDDANKAYLGVQALPVVSIKERYEQGSWAWLPSTVMWFYGLLVWLYILNLGIGLVNLLPLGPVDGGRMLLTALGRYFDKKRAEHIWKLTSSYFLFLLILNIVLAILGDVFGTTASIIQ
jgi:membrane-associated protease RseP (regulator of RpoE activity)